MNHLLEFYGTECPHCISMHELVLRLKKEEGLEIESLEVWHNKENEIILLAIDNGELCGGVPFFYNTETKKFICGESNYETFKKWAKGEEFIQEE